MRNNKNYSIGKILGFIYSITFYPSMFYLIFYAFIPLIKKGAIPPNSKYAYAAFFFAAIFFIYEAAKIIKLIKNNKFTKNIKDGFSIIPHFITNAINFVLLFFVYFMGVGVVSMVSKLLGNHYLDLKKNGSSWIVRKLKKKPIEDYYRSF